MTNVVVCGRERCGSPCVFREFFAGDLRRRTPGLSRAADGGCGNSPVFFAVRRLLSGPLSAKSVLRIRRFSLVRADFDWFVS
jgi:hypothetical protein